MGGPEARRLLSLHHLTVREVSPPALVEIAAEVGLRQVCIFVRAPSRALDLFPLVADEPTRRDVARRMAHTGVAVHNIEVFSLTPRTQVETFRATLEVGAALGAKRATALVNDADDSRALQTFAAFCQLAGEYGLRVGIEFMAFAAVDTLDKAVRLLAEAGQANADLAVDALHLQRTGGSVDALAALDPALVGYAQICDAPLDMPRERWFDEAVEDRLVPGTGELPLRAFLAALPDCVIDLEVPSRQLQARGLDAMERTRLIVAATARLLSGIG
jgi:sugar phosphate isomerase/epimerase